MHIGFILIFNAASQGTPKEGLLYSSSSGDYLFKSSAPAIAAPRLLLLSQLGLAFTFQHQRQPAHLIICLAYSFGQKFIDLSRRRIFLGFFFRLFWDSTFPFRLLPILYSFVQFLVGSLAGSIPIDVFQCWPLFAQDTGRA